MRNTRASDRFMAAALLSVLAMAGTATASSTMHNPQKSKAMTAKHGKAESLSPAQQAIVPIGSFAATGDIARLGDAIGQGLDAGLTVSDIQEVLVQLYAYAGFPRSLNALGELMKVLESRKERGIDDALGQPPRRAIPTGDALLAAGTANQTTLVGAPVVAPIFDFAPAIDTYLKTHLFGDIFERDNLDWQAREIATVAMLAAMTGTDAQLASHLRISRNVGMTTRQLQQLAAVLSARVQADAGQRVRKALDT